MNTFYKRLSMVTLFVMILGLAIYISSAKAQSGGDATTPEVSTPAASDTAVPADTGTAIATEAPAVTQSAGPAMPTSQPILHAQLNGTDIDGIYGSACWPKTDGTPYCNFVDDPQPDKSVTVQATDQITFQVEPATPTPAMLTAKLLDDVDQSGEPKQIDLQANNNVLKISDLKNGSQRVEVDLIYNDVANAQPFISYVYLLQVGGGAATSQATTNVEGSATVEITAEASASAMPEATTNASPESTTTTTTAEATQAQVTSAASETATEASTPSEVPTEVTTTPTEAATTPAAPEATSTASATTESAITTTSAAPVATTEATSASSTTLPPAETATTEAAITATPIPMQTVVPAASATATSALPANTIAPTSTPFFPSGTGATATPLTSAEFTVMVEGRVYEPIVVNNCTIAMNGAQTCTKRPTNAASTRILAAPSSVAQLTFRGSRPLAITVNLLSSDGLTHISQQSIPPDNVTLYDLPQTPGSYLLAIEIKTADKDTTYYYRLFIGG